MQRRALKERKRKAQGGLCTVCQETLPDRGAVLDRFQAMKGYTNENPPHLRAMRHPYPDGTTVRVMDATSASSVASLIASMRDALAEFGTLPESLSAGSGRIPGTAFFPGGDGLVRPRVNEDRPDVLIVGHDFGTLTYFGSCIVAGEDRTTQATWRGILARLAAASVDPQRCLFSNAFVGYRKAGGNTDDFPARMDREYLRRCRAFMERQIDALRPRAIVALGKHVPWFLAGISRDLPWISAREFAEIDRLGPFVSGASFGEHHANVCVLVHPSFGLLNVGRRRYVDARGEAHAGVEAEVALLRDAMQATLTTQ